MDQLSSLRNKVALLFFMLVIGAGFGAAAASDYYFRPTNIAMVQSWTKELNFTVSNPSKMPIVLKISSRQVGIMPTKNENGPSALAVLPASVVLMPGETQRIDVAYREENAFSEMSSFEVTVEQLPILFMVPGTIRTPRMMDVKRYVADIEVWQRQVGGYQYAFNRIDQSLELKQGDFSGTKTYR